MQDIKCVVIGDHLSGKTCSITTYTADLFSKVSVPTTFDNYLTEVLLDDGRLFNMVIWDTAGDEEYERIRVLSYPQTNVFMICFSIVSPSSFENVKIKWYQEIQRHASNIPFILVGTKMDLREDEETLTNLKADNLKPITTGAGRELAYQLGAFKYLECSALSRRAVSQVFEESVQCVLLAPRPKNQQLSGCLVL